MEAVRVAAECDHRFTGDPLFIDNELRWLCERGCGKEQRRRVQLDGGIDAAYCTALGEVHAWFDVSLLGSSVIDEVCIRCGRPCFLAKPSTGPLGQVAQEVYAWSRQQGFYDNDYQRGFDGHLMLVVSEAVEALEHWRDGHEVTEVFMVRRGIADLGEPYQVERGVPITPGDQDEAIADGWKPDGVPLELADILIRTLDIMAHYGLDPDELIKLKMAYNRTRPYRNGVAPG